MKKTERHQIKRDELVTAIGRGTFYVENHARRIGFLAVGAVVLAAGIFGGRAWWSSREDKASYLLGQIVQTYRAPVTTSLEALQPSSPGSKNFAGVEERNAEVVRLADEMLTRFSWSRLTPKALYYKGLALADLKKSDEAARAFQEVVTKHSGDFLAPLARYELARLKEAQGNPSEALIQYQALAEEARGFFPREEGLLGVARCQEALGRPAEALKTYRKIVSDFPNSDYQFEAKKKVEELS